MQQSLTFAAFTTAALLSSSALAAQQIGVVGAANPAVTITAQDGSNRTVKTGDPVYLNDTVITNPSGSAQLMFNDKSALTISPDSRITVDAYIYDPEAKDGIMSVSAAKGALRFIGGALTKKKPVTIKTPVSTIGIRGGIADTFIEPGGSTDALFIFGKELTMQGTDGSAPMSVTSFGSGLGIGENGGAPASLPAAILQTRITRSPTRAAVEQAPPSSGGNEVEQKMQQQGSPAGRAADGNARLNQNATPPAGGGSSSGGGSQSTEDAGSSDSGNAQQNLRGDVDNFVSSGGDSDGDGVLDFQVSTNGDRNSGNVLQDFLNFLSGADDDLLRDSGKDDTLVLSDDTTSGGTDSTLPGGNDDTTPGGEDTTSGGDSSGNDTLSGDDTSAGGGGGGGGVVVTPVTSGAHADSLALLEDASGSGSVNILSNDTGTGTLSIQSINSADTVYPDGYGNYTISGAEGSLIIYSNGNVSFYPADDLAAGETLTQSFSYELIDSDGLVTTATASVTITGQDMFGNNTTWSATGPAIKPWTPTISGGQGEDITHRGHFSTLSTGGGTLSQGYVRATDASGDLAAHFVVTREDGVTIPGAAENHTIADILLPSAATDALTPGVQNIYDYENTFESAEGIEDITVGFSGTHVSTIGNAFNYYMYRWDSDQDYLTTDDYSYLSFFLGTSRVQENYDRLAATGISTAQAQSDYTRMRQDSIDLANTLSINDGYQQALINYSFLPDAVLNLDANGDSEFGLFNYNSLDYALPGQQLTGAAGSSRYGLLVDWQNAKYFTGYVDFLGADYGAIGALNPTMITAFGNIQKNTDVLVTDQNTLGGTLFKGAYFGYSTANDGMSFGRTNSYLDEVYSDPDADDTLSGSNAISAILLQGQESTLSGGNDHFTMPAVADGRADGLSTDRNLSAQKHYNGFTAGIATINDTAVSRIAGEVDVTLSGGRDDTTTGGHSVASVIDIYGADLTPAQTTLEAGMNDSIVDGADTIYGANAAVQDNMYGAASANKQTVILAPGSNTSDTAVCSSCEYAHWGVWSASYSNGPDEVTTGLVPYVAGEITPYAPGTWSDPGNPGTLGTVTYNGSAMANMAITDNDTNTTEVVNAIGTMTADIDLGNRKILDGNMVIDFGGIGEEASRSLTITNNADIDFNATANHFDGPATANFNDRFGVTDPSGSGQITGALFGPRAEEVGGKFIGNANTYTGGESIDAGGIFIGKK
jgi:hypothetical protein